MYNALIWLLVFGALMIIYYMKVSLTCRRQTYDLENFLLAGKRLSNGRFILASTTVCFLGLMPLSHIGLFYRSGFSYGFAALAAIVVPLVAALFAQRMWILGRIYSPLTPAQLLGNYYSSRLTRVVTALIAVLVAIVLAIMCLRITASLVEGLMPENAPGPSEPGNPLLRPPSLVAMAILAALLFFHAAWGGMAAILRIAAPAGVMLLLALVLSALVALDAMGGPAGFLDNLARLQNNPVTVPLFQAGVFFDILPAAAPSNMAWPGTMVASSLVALAGLATAPAALMASSTAATGKSHARAQFFAAALVTGLVLLTTTIAIALLARLPGDLPDTPAFLVQASASLPAGEEPTRIMQLLRTTPLGSPVFLALVALALIAGLIAATSASLIAAGGMVSNDILHERLKRDGRRVHQKTIARYAIAVVLLVALVLAVASPGDPLTLFLLAGSLGLQLLPGMAGLCYFERLDGKAVEAGAIAGVTVVIIASQVTQGGAELVGIPLPFDAWPLSLHPAFWGLMVNLLVLTVISFSGSFFKNSKAAKEQMRQLRHRRSYHVLPDGGPLLPPDAGRWRAIALVTGALFLVVTVLPFVGLQLPALLPTPLPVLWGWQLLSWLTGLALVYVVAYRLQPRFDPEQLSEGPLTPQRRRFRVKAGRRKLTGDAAIVRQSHRDKATT